jgi:uncharacterized protein YqjF (DUF2071 family)
MRAGESRGGPLRGFAPALPRSAAVPYSPDPLTVLDHRPWPLPAARWVMRQVWHDLLFAHWPVAESELARLLPPELALDTFDGRAWLGVVPFRMSGIRMRGLPPLPGTSAFPELNVRTYVVRDGKPGVWFFSLDAANALAVAVARRWFHLPYFRARMRCAAAGARVAYPSERVHAAALVADYGPAGDVFRSRPGSLEHWLTERYCLYARRASGQLARGEIHHAPWPLQRAEAEFAVQGMTASLGLALPRERPLLHFARRLDVRVWSPVEC